MTRIRLLHIEDEPDIREVVELAIALDPVFELRSCESGAEGLAVAAAWRPDMILLDVMMPVMDGPATLARLRAGPETARIPILFMTARAQTRETERLRALGAVGVIAKPFDPMTLAAAIRTFVKKPASAPLDELRSAFQVRVEKDAAVLEQDRLALQRGLRTGATLEAIRQRAHSLAGAGGIYGFAGLSDAAATLEEAAVAEMADGAAAEHTDRALDNLLIEAQRCRPAVDAPGRARHAT
jgi:CheY-like chemotaxis protein